MKTARRIQGALLAGIGLILVLCIAAGTGALLRYENTPGRPGGAPPHWPPDSAISRSTSQYTLVMLAHPNCPCTRASVAEMEVLMTRFGGRLTAYVLFSKPGAEAPEVRGTDRWKRAEAIPGVSVVYDRGGLEAKRFGGEVSGQTMLYDPSGRLVFSGGITGGRGRQGSNPGADTMMSLLGGKESARQSTPVFGCALHDPGAETLREDSSWKK